MHHEYSIKLFYQNLSKLYPYTFLKLCESSNPFLLFPKPSVEYLFYVKYYEPGLDIALIC